MPQSVSDIRSNLPENIVSAAKIVGRGKHRRAVFEAIYFGKKKWKTVSYISKRTGLNRVRVLQEGGRLEGNQLVEQRKINGETAYAKDKTLSHHKNKILAAARSTKKLASIATKQNPKGASGGTFQVRLVNASAKPRLVTVDSISAFRRVRDVRKLDPKLRLKRVAESRLKSAFKSIIGESHEFKDWGGETNDLFTNKLRIASARKRAAFAFKGKGTQGPLTPKKMGQNADQVERLFKSQADAFFVVYHGKIEESMHTLMDVHALATSLKSGRSVIYGVIDGDDLNRLARAYPKEFGFEK